MISPIWFLVRVQKMITQAFSRFIWPPGLGVHL